MTDKRGEVKWMAGDRQQEWKEMQAVVDPKYSRVGERIRHITPSALQCSMFCGGRQCKYDNPVKWKEEEMAIKGLYSSWITSNILAMARPSTYAIKEFDIVAQFKQNNIGAVINLQHPGEHASCGFGLEDSGFSYEPQHLMDEDVFFYNFCWDDYGVRALQSILDMVKVMDFALMTGKVAIHCHAGLGRTGVLIACYFVYSQRMIANSAINAVRARRPRSIQTRGQIACVRDFEKYLQPMWIIYSNTTNGHKPFTLSQFLRRQAHILHGEEERDLKYVPKVVFVICQRLLQLAGVNSELRTVAILKRRAFTSLSLTDDLNSDLTSADQAMSLARQEKRADSDSLLDHTYGKGDSQLSDTSLATDVFYDSFADGPEQACDMDEISPEAVLQHSVSESVLLKDPKESMNASGSEHKRTNGLDKLKLGHTSLHGVDVVSNYTEIDTARFSDADEGITINVKRTSIQAELTEVKTNNNDSLNASNEESASFKVDNDNSESEKNSPKSQISVKVDSSNSVSLVADAEERDVQPRNYLAVDAEELSEKLAQCFSPKINYTRISTMLEKYKNGLNTTEATWQLLSEETNVNLLCCLLWNWLEQLEEPVITNDDREIILKNLDDPVRAFESLDRGKRKTLQVAIFTFLKTSASNEDLKDKALQKLAMVLTKVTPLPRNARSERAALDQESKKNKVENRAGFLDFMIKLSKSKLFDA